MLGMQAEKEFGRSNWKDLYSVISGGEEYRAVTPDGEVIGRLDARFVNSQESGEISLGGRDWSMVKCDEGHNIVVVVPSEAGNVPDILDRQRGHGFLCPCVPDGAENTGTWWLVPDAWRKRNGIDRCGSCPHPGRGRERGPVRC